MKSLCAVIPSYFDIQSAVEISTELINGSNEYKIQVFILDESLGTDKFENELHPSISILKPSRRLGQQKQIVSFLRSEYLSKEKFDFVVVLDADGEDNPQDVFKLVRIITSENCDTAIATRSSRKSQSAFKIGYFAFKLFSRAVTGMWITSGSFSASRFDWIRSEIENPVFNHSFAGGLLACSGKKFRLPLHRSPRRYGKSTMNSSGLILHGVDVLLSQSKIVTARFFILLLSGTAISFFLVAIALWAKIRGWASRGWTTAVMLGSTQISIMLCLLFLISFIHYGLMNMQNQARINYEHIK